MIIKYAAQIVTITTCALFIGALPTLYHWLVETCPFYERHPEALGIALTLLGTAGLFATVISSARIWWDD